MFPGMKAARASIDGNCAMLYTTIARRASIQKSAQFDVATVKSPTWGAARVKFRQAVLP